MFSTTPKTVLKSFIRYERISKWGTREISDRRLNQIINLIRRYFGSRWQIIRKMHGCEHAGNELLRGGGFPQEKARGVFSSGFSLHIMLLRHEFFAVIFVFERFLRKSLRAVFSFLWHFFWRFQRWRGQGPTRLSQNRSSAQAKILFRSVLNEEQGIDSSHRLRSGIP